MDPENPQIVEERKTNALSKEIEFSLDLLRIYYSNHFPLTTFRKWLTNSNLDGAEDYFEKREFSFTLKGDGQKGEIYCRYQSFRNEERLLEALSRERIEQVPIKIDIGAIYSSVPNNSSSFKDNRNAIAKEFVLDIDMNDYDALRTCCEGATVCRLCWKFMTVAANVLEATLKEDFGFSQILWVYSGRRGMHCWVSDVELMKNPNTIRRAIVENLLLVQGNEKAESNVKKGILRKHLNPSVRRTLKILEKSFNEIILEDQKIFEKKDFQSRILGMIEEEKHREELKKMWNENQGGSFRKWEVFLECLNFWIKSGNSKAKDNKSKSKFSRRLKYLKEEIILTCLYPRLDSKVSEDIGHLLKSPFCIHPSTGKVCVPIMDHKSFNPEKVPRLVKINSGGVEKESFDVYVQFFSDYVTKCYKENRSKINMKKNGRNIEDLSY